ncbi:MAG: 16S rRNA (cytosine(1402)-N(4))-methyltransferase RsmH [Candidatus Dojkabacteria bacterium]
MTKHKPVLLKQAVSSLQVEPGGVYLDATLGGGGHFLAIMKLMNGSGRLVGVDQDNNAIEAAKKLLVDGGFKKEGSDWHKKGMKVFLLSANFRHLPNLMESIGEESFDGILADLGMSTDQLFDSPRGFSFGRQGELDMRMSQNLTVTAADLLAGLYKKELEQLFKTYGDVYKSGAIAAEIVKQRKRSPIKTTRHLKKLVGKISPSSEAKVFQALRIAVNDELNALKDFLPAAFKALNAGGRLAIINFHSGEDRVVKEFTNEKVESGDAKYTAKLIRPDALEIKENPKSRSAKLRVIEKI